MQNNKISDEMVINLYLHNEFPKTIINELHSILPMVNCVTLSYNKLDDSYYFDKMNAVINGHMKHETQHVPLNHKLGYKKLANIVNLKDKDPVAKQVFLIYIPLNPEAEKLDVMDISLEDWKRELYMGFDQIKSFCENIIEHLPENHHETHFIEIVETQDDSLSDNCCASIIHSLIKKNNQMINEVYGKDHVKSSVLFYDAKEFPIHQLIDTIKH